MDRENRWYRFMYAIAKATIGLLYPIRVLGAANVPSGAAIVCANHSSWVDPFLMAFALTKKEHLCMMAKIELFKSKLLGGVLKAIGTFPVDRGKADLEALRSAMRCLKNGKKLGIFPEGTRCREDGEAEPKGGAVRLSEKTGVPLLPMYVPRQKRLFRRLTVVIGEPFGIEKSEKRRSKEEYEAMYEALMKRISDLGANVSGKAEAR